MSAGAAALLFIVGGLLALAVDFLVPPHGSQCLDDIERGSTTIMPEDR